LPAVRLRARRNDDRVEQVIADAIGEPAETSNVAVANRASELHFNGHQATISALGDEVHLVLARDGAQVRDARLGGLRVDPDAQRDERLE